LRPVVTDEQLEVLRLLVDRRCSLGDEHTRKTCQLHQLLLELIPGGAKSAVSRGSRNRSGSPHPTPSAGSGTLNRFA
jgi:transposase